MSGCAATEPRRNHVQRAKADLRRRSEPGVREARSGATSPPRDAELARIARRSLHHAGQGQPSGSSAPGVGLAIAGRACPSKSSVGAATTTPLPITAVLAIAPFGLT